MAGKRSGIRISLAPLFKGMLRPGFGRAVHARAEGAPGQVAVTVARLVSVLRPAEQREHLTAAVNTHLLEYRREVVLEGVARDEKTLGRRLGVMSGEQRGGHLPLAPGKSVDAAATVECFTGSRVPEGDCDLAVGSPFEWRPSITTHRPSAT